jgi:hypothetical protein
MRAERYVPASEVHDFAIIDAARRPALEAWVAHLVPAHGAWPGAAEVGAAAYVDAAIAAAPDARPPVLLTIDQLERLAADRGWSSFAACPSEDCDRILTAVAADRRFAAAFQQVLELTYEAYYRDERVCDVMRERTGFDSRLPHLGSAMEPFDPSLLDRVAALPPRYRQVEA